MPLVEHGAEPRRISLTPCPECGKPEPPDEDQLSHFCAGECAWRGHVHIPYVPHTIHQEAVDLLKTIARGDVGFEGLDHQQAGTAGRVVLRIDHETWAALSKYGWGHHR